LSSTQVRWNQMKEQQTATLDTARVQVRPARPILREAPRGHVVTAVHLLKALLEAAQDGRLEWSLLDLANAAACDVEMARRAVASLEAIDHVLSVDVHRVPAEQPWVLTWAPETSIVNLMLDWDLLTLEISVVELSEWLGASLPVTARALDWLALEPGVAVVRTGSDPTATVLIDIVLDRCPLTAETLSAVG